MGRTVLDLAVGAFCLLAAIAIFLFGALVGFRMAAKQLIGEEGKKFREDIARNVAGKIAADHGFWSNVRNRN